MKTLIALIVKLASFFYKKSEVQVTNVQVTDTAETAASACYYSVASLSPSFFTNVAAVADRLEATVAKCNDLPAAQRYKLATALWQSKNFHCNNVDSDLDYLGWMRSVLFVHMSKSHRTSDPETVARMEIVYRFRLMFTCHLIIMGYNSITAEEKARVSARLYGQALTMMPWAAKHNKVGNQRNSWRAALSRHHALPPYATDEFERLSKSRS